MYIFLDSYDNHWQDLFALTMHLLSVFIRETDLQKETKINYFSYFDTMIAIINTVLKKLVIEIQINFVCDKRNDRLINKCG